MNRQFARFTLASSLAMLSLWATQSMAADDPDGACETQLISGATAYPDERVRARLGGKVLLTLMVAPDGSVTDAVVSGSSGMRTLDRAALKGALTQWRFAPSACGDAIAKDVAVTFEPRPFTTLSAANVPGFRRKLASAEARGCDVRKESAGVALIACTTDAAAPTRLAER
jgi:TonB family protein